MREMGEKRLILHRHEHEEDVKNLSPGERVAALLLVSYLLLSRRGREDHAGPQGQVRHSGQPDLHAPFLGLTRTSRSIASPLANSACCLGSKW